MDYRVYCGVDFHARQQTICSLTTEDGVVSTDELKHQDKAELRAFYSQFSGPVLVGLEASGYSPWFEQMLEELGHESGWATPSRSVGAPADDRRPISAMPS